MKSFTKSIVDYIEAVFAHKIPIMRVSPNVPVYLDEVNEEVSGQKHYLLDPEVALFSYYLKIAGLSQELDFGDVYYSTEDGKTKVRSYELKELDDWNDFEFRANCNYVRVVREEEAFNLIHALGFQTESFVVNNEYCSMQVISAKFQISIIVTGHNTHSTALKAAYTAYNLNKSIATSNTQIKEEQIIIFRYPEEK